MALVTLAYAFCLSVGQAADQRIRITRKKHGYRAMSVSRHGLNSLRQITRPAIDNRHKLVRLVDVLLDRTVRQLTNDQETVKIIE